MVRNGDVRGRSSGTRFSGPVPTSNCMRVSGVCRTGGVIGAASSSKMVRIGVLARKAGEASTPIGMPSMLVRPSSRSPSVRLVRSCTARTTSPGTFCFGTTISRGSPPLIGIIGMSSPRRVAAPPPSIAMRFVSGLRNAVCDGGDSTTSIRRWSRAVRSGSAATSGPIGATKSRRPPGTAPAGIAGPCAAPGANGDCRPPCNDSATMASRRRGSDSGMARTPEGNRRVGSVICPGMGIAGPCIGPCRVPAGPASRAPYCVKPRSATASAARRACRAP